MVKSFHTPWKCCKIFWYPPLFHSAPVPGIKNDRSLRYLHWLKVGSRIIYKIPLLTNKRIKGLCSQNLKIEYKAYNCRPQDYLLLETRAAKTKYGKRTFDYAAPRLWNALPLEVRMEENIDKFKGQIKTILFNGTEELKRRASMYNWVKTVISVCVQ